MIDWLVFLFTGGFAGGIFAFVFSLFKVGPGKPEFSFGKAVFFSLVAAWSLPFLFVEFHTRRNAPQLKQAISEYFESNECPLYGTIAYFKVVYANDKNAFVYLVAKEPQDWGGTDKPLLKLKLQKMPTSAKNAKIAWHVVKEEVMRSDRLQKDSIVWPPYQ